MNLFLNLRFDSSLAFLSYFLVMLENEKKASVFRGWKEYKQP
jgi:hypothetical protein